MTVTRAWLAGIVHVAKAPLLIVLVVITTMAAVVPFGLVLRAELETALAQQPPVDLGSTEVDANWWSEFRAQADGLAATFTPTVIGFAAPLDNLSSLLDGSRRPLVLALPVGVALVMWAWLWGVALRRFDLGRGLSVAEAVRAGITTLPRFIGISVVAVAVQVVLYLTIHPLLFQVAYPALIGGGMSEPSAFAVRVALYLLFGVAIVTVSLLADYARAAQVVLQPPRLGEAFAAAAGFVRGRFVAVIALYLMSAVVFAILMTAYGVIDVFGGTRVGGWRGIAIGQAFIVGRLVLRLVFGASVLEFFKRNQRS